MKLFSRLRLAFLIIFTNRAVVNVRDLKTGRFLGASYNPKIKKAFYNLLKYSQIQLISKDFDLSNIDDILESKKYKNGLTLYVRDDVYRTINRYFILAGIGNLGSQCEIYSRKNKNSPVNRKVFISTLYMKLEYGRGEITFVLLDLLDNEKLNVKHLLKKGECLLVDNADQSIFFSQVFKLKKMLKC
jgi:hypothetical protein